MLPNCDYSWASRYHLWLIGITVVAASERATSFAGTPALSVNCGQREEEEGGAIGFRSAAAAEHLDVEVADLLAQSVSVDPPAARLRLRPSPASGRSSPQAAPPQRLPVRSSRLDRRSTFNLSRPNGNPATHANTCRWAPPVNQRIIIH